MEKALQWESLLQKRAERYRKKKEKLTEEGDEMVFFVRGATTYVVPLKELSEIRKLEHLSRFPSCSPVIKGVVNVRGRLVIVHDLGSFQKQSLPLPEEGWLLVGFGDSEGVSLLADDVVGIQKLAMTELEPIPLTVGERTQCYHGLSKEGAIVLNMEQLLQHKDFFYA